MLAEKGAELVDEIVSRYAELTKADEEEAQRIESIVLPLLIDWTAVSIVMEPYLREMALDGVAVAGDQLSNVIAISLDLPNERAIAYAKNRAAEMVGMKWVDGKLVPNPNAHWAITESTRTMLRDDVVRALEEGWSNDKLAATLRSNYAFSAERAANIARTETAMADAEGNMALYLEAEANGIDLLKKWVTAKDDRVSPDCVMNGESKPLPLKQAFPSGVQKPPDHPRCRCVISPVVVEDD